MKTIFINEKEFQRFSLEDLKRISSIYYGEWKIKKEKLLKTLVVVIIGKRYKDIQEDKDVVRLKKKFINGKR